MPTLLTDHIVHTEIPLRQVLFEDFKSLGKELPIKGGWGYTREDAIIIDKNDPIVNCGLPFDGVAIEYIIVEKRIFEELIIFRPKDQQFAGINHQLITQKLVIEENKAFDHLKIAVTAFKQDEFEKAMGEMTDEQMYHYEADYWFDITSFFGKSQSTEISKLGSVG